MKVYGYCRVSTKQQSIERQIRNIREQYPEAKIYQEAYTGTTTDRKEWKKLQRQLQSGDTVVFDSVSRMSRNAEEGFAAYLNSEQVWYDSESVWFRWETVLGSELDELILERLILRQQAAP